MLLSIQKMPFNYDFLTIRLKLHGRKEETNCIASCHGHMPFTCMCRLLLTSTLVTFYVAEINTVAKAT